MSRMTTSRPSLSWAMAAIRRACSSGLKRLSVYPGRVVVKPLAADDLRNRGRDVGLDEPLAQLAGGDRGRLDVEEQDALGVVELRQHRLELLAREPGPRRDGEQRQLQHVLRLLPRREVAELVRADQEHG